jgi:hypothetical protein
MQLSNSENSNYQPSIQITLADVIETQLGLYIGISCHQNGKALFTHTDKQCGSLTLFYRLTW